MKRQRVIFLVLLLMALLGSILIRKKNLQIQEVSFVAVGDTGTGSEEQYRVGQSMKKACDSSRCVGFIILGDVIYEKGISSVEDPQLQTKFELIYRDIFKPFYIALGNHDHYGCISCEIAYSTMSARWKMPNYYYKQSFDNLVDLFVIDTEKLNQEQVDWATKELQLSKAKWKIFAGHHPLISHDMRHGNASGEQKQLLEKILCNANNNIDVYLAGHAHNLEDAGDYCGVRLLIAGGGGAPIGDIVKNDSPFAASTYGFISLKATFSQLRVEFIDVRGAILHRWIKSR